MLDIYLHEYKDPSEQPTGYNAAHRFRMYKENEVDTTLIEKGWQSVKAGVLNELVERVRNLFDTTLPFAFAVAPSNTKIFVNDIESATATAFPNAVNLSGCFSKVDGFKAGIQNAVLPEEELRKSIALNKDFFYALVGNEKMDILLLDDVFSYGNTFNAMKLLVSDIYHSKNLFTAAILKTKAQ